MLLFLSLKSVTLENSYYLAMVKLWFSVNLLVGNGNTEGVHQLKPYRQGVIIVVVNSNGQILVGKSANSIKAGPLWDDLNQALTLPQGGIEVGEVAEEAFFREMYEEVGLTKDDIVGGLVMSEFKTRYTFSDETIDEFVAQGRNIGNYRGQEHIWGIVKIANDKHTIDPTTTKDQEFLFFKWLSIDDAIVMAPAFKKEAYKEGLTRLRLVIESVAKGN